MAYNLSGDYPVAANYLIVSRRAKDCFYVQNVVTNETVELDEAAYRFLKGLDGNTDPNVLGARFGVDVEEAMEFFDLYDLLRTGGRKLECYPTINLITCFVPTVKRTKSIIPKLFNLILLLSWCPIILLGLYCYENMSFPINSEFVLLGLIFGIICGLFLHEAAHAMACLAYGGYFFEAGIMAGKAAGAGAYVMIDFRKIKSRLKKTQIMVAGVEMNFLLAGILLVLSSVCPILSGFLYMAAFINITLGAINLAGVNGFDGCSAMLQLLGFEDEMEQIWNVLGDFFNKSKKKKPDTIVVLISITMLVFQLLLPLFWINAVLNIVGFFI